MSTATVTIMGGDSLAYRTEGVSSATRTLTPLRDIPQSITVVTKEQMTDQSMESIADVVNYVPGITSHQGENNRDQLVIRGNSTSADFFLNGVRDDVQYYRDLYNVDRVEVLKGPNAMIFGRGGGGGVVNRVAREAGFARAREITAQGGSFRDKRKLGQFSAARLSPALRYQPKSDNYPRRENKDNVFVRTLSRWPHGRSRHSFVSGKTGRYSDFHFLRRSQPKLCEGPCGSCVGPDNAPDRPAHDS